MTLNTISPGVNTSFSTELNENFALNSHETTIVFDQTLITVTSAATSDGAATVTTPPANFAGQNCLVEAWARIDYENATGGDAFLRNITDSTNDITFYQSAGEHVVFGAQTVSLTNLNDTKEFTIRITAGSGTTNDVSCREYYIKCTLLPN